MDKIKNISITSCDESKYIKTARMNYEQDGTKKTWDLMKIHDSVAIVIFNVTRQVLLFVKQFRPAVFYADVKLEDSEGDIDVNKYSPSPGITIELCAGMIDKEKSISEIAQEEVLEECGYAVPLSALQKVSSYRYDVGITGNRQTLFYAEVTDAMKVSEGGGNSYEGEYIEVVEMDLPQAQSLMYDEKVARPTSLILGLMWFFQNRAPNKQSQKI